MLVLTRKLGETIVVGDCVRIKVLSVHSGRIRLGITAPPNLPICREERYRPAERSAGPDLIERSNSHDSASMAETLFVRKAPSRREDSDMADLQRVKAEVLADGRIDTHDVDLICRELYAEGKIDQEVVDFLIDLRDEAHWVCSRFERLCLDCAKYHLLADGSIDAEKAAWLRLTLLSHHKVNKREMVFLRDRKDQAVDVCDEFQELYDKCVQRSEWGAP
jgi:carbon storage regulator